MTLEELEKAKEIAGLREALLSRVHVVQTVDCPNAVFGFLLDAEMEEVLRNACVAEIRRRAAVYEADLRELGVVIPGDAPPLSDASVPVTFKLDEEPILRAKMSTHGIESVRQSLARIS